MGKTQSFSIQHFVYVCKNDFKSSDLIYLILQTLNYNLKKLVFQHESGIRKRVVCGNDRKKTKVGCSSS